MEGVQIDSSQTLPPLGFISVDIIIHRPAGDPFNAKTWPFPIIHERATNTPEAAVVCAGAYDDNFIARFVDAGKRLAKRGAVGIITSCGFLAMAQPELAARLPIPIMTSALIQVPSLLALLPPNRTIGILTFDATRLGHTHLGKLGIPIERCHIRGALHGGALQRHIRQGEIYVHEDISAELVRAAKELISAQPDVAAICLECTNMPPFAEAIQSAVNLPVFDVHSAGCWFYSGLVSMRQSRWGSIAEDKIETRM